MSVDDDQCKACDAGFACTVKSSIATTAECGAGYFCTTEATTTTPNTICYDYDKVAGTCSIVATATEISNAACTDGTYDTSGATPYCTGVPTTQSVCPQGYYCE